MNITTAIGLSTLVILGSEFLALPNTANAGGFGPMNMMNPSKWMGGGNRGDYDDDYYGDRGYGPPPPGYGTPPPIGAPGYGYAPPPAGAYGYTPPAAAPAYAAPAGAYGYTPPAAAPASTPATSSSGVDSETRIKELEDRIRQLESTQPTAGSSSVPSYGGGDYQPSFAGGDYQPNSTTDSYQPGSSGSSYQPSSAGSGYPSIPPSGTYEPSSPVFRPNN